jgi:photosystem II stability/assembly factor-like uncharacterized protein
MPDKYCLPQQRTVDRRTLLGACGAAVLASGGLAVGANARAAASQLPWPALRPAVALRRVDAAVLLAVTKAGARLVACGERGVIAYSDDAGVTWSQAAVPVSVSITALSFVSDKRGWAVGHAGVILETRDGGTTWQVQLRPDMQGDGALALFDVHFEGEQRGIAVGAFGLVMKTSDGGAHWTRVSVRAPNPRDLHVYSARQYGGTVYVTGEQGLFMRSSDAGASFEAVQTPYAGSYFCQALDSDSNVILAGLRGTVMRWRGGRFEPIEVPTPISVLSMRGSLAGDRVVAVNQIGDLMSLPRNASRMERLAQSGAPLVSAVETSPGSFVGVGALGTSRIQARESSSTAEVKARS